MTMETRPGKYMALREIGRRLSIPPSTMVYYRDRFSKYIPYKMSAGGRCRYPAETLAVFETIRRCFSRKWSWEQIDAALAARFPVVADHDHAAGQSASDNSTTIADNHALLKEMAASMARIAQALDQQGTFIGQLHDLQQDLRRLREDKQQSDLQYRDQISRLAEELNRLKKAGRRESDRQARGQQDRRAGLWPGSDFLHHPLTVHYPPQRHLGIKDSRNAALNLDQLIETIEKNVSGAKSADLSWHKYGDAWTLKATLRSPHAEKDRQIILEAQSTITPKGNPVTEILRMRIEDQELSKDDLLKFFKLYKAGGSPGGGG